MDIRYRCRERVAKAAPAEQAAFYQCRYDRNKFGQGRQMTRILLQWHGKTDIGGELFADYQKKRIFDRAGIQVELASYDVVSFDVFDTLLERSVRYPADVFWKMEETYQIPGFARRRIEAERTARQRKYARSGTREVFIEDIYRVLAELLPGRLVSEKQEFAMELSCCRANTGMQRIVQSLLADGKQVIAVSDMYLHKGQIRRILQKCGYTGLDQIYVSCEYRAGKSDGKLFPIVLRELGDSGRMVHIGDNFYADVFRPKELCMQTVHYIKNR